MAEPSPSRWEKRAAAAARQGRWAARGMGCTVGGPPTIAQRARTFFQSGAAHEGVTQLPGQAAFRDEAHRHLGMNHQGEVAQLRLLSRMHAGCVTSRGRDTQRTPEAQSATRPPPFQAPPKTRSRLVSGGGCTALRRWLACCDGGAGGRAATIVGGVRGRGGEGSREKGAAGEEALRAHFPGGRFQTGARRGGVGKRGRGAAAIAWTWLGLACAAGWLPRGSQIQRGCRRRRRDRWGRVGSLATLGCRTARPGRQRPAARAENEPL
jgi:hypothetical protein